MKADSEALLMKRGLGWRGALLFIALAVTAILVVYSQTALSMVALWRSSDTYAHGYLIAPIALFLAWRKRRELAAIAPRVDALGFVLLGGAGFLWLVAEAGQVQIVQQYAVTAMIAAAVLAIAGRRAARALAFPLAFLLFAVPFGEAFIPRLIEWTADFTVGALRLSGIPVYREGSFFTIPSGNWSVVEACSGLRYLIASMTVGALYAYLTYRRFWKRAVFFSAAIAVPILANFVRAYLIVMIGHLSSMRLAVGVDHFIYGWVFFGVVIALLFWIGSFGRDASLPAARSHVSIQPASQKSAFAAAAVAAIALAAVWPIYASHLGQEDATSVALAAPPGAAGWVLASPPASHWRPRYVGASASALAVYRHGERSVALYLAHYRDQRQGAELVSSQNVVAGDAASPWASMGESFRTENTLPVRETRLRSSSGRLLVWDWYRIGGHDLSNPYVAKAILARDKLLGRGDASAAIVVAAPYETRPDVAADTLRSFIRDMLPAIERVLTDAAGDPA